MQEENNVLLTTMVMKEDFNENGNVTSGKYYLPLAPNLTALANVKGIGTVIVAGGTLLPATAFKLSCEDLFIIRSALGFC